MTIKIQGPDGNTYEFPDGTDQAVMKAAMQKRFGAPQQAQPTAAPIEQPQPDRAAMVANLERLQGEQQQADRRLNNINNILRPANAVSRFANAATLGVPDRLAATAQGGFDKLTGNEGGNRLEGLQANKEQVRQQFPISSGVSDIGGAIFGLGKVANAGGTFTRLVPQSLSRGKGLLASTMAVGADGMALAGTESLIAGRDAVQDAKEGGLLSAGANVLFRGAGSALQPLLRGAKPKTPTTKSLLDSASSSRKQLDDLGVVYSPEQLKQLALGVTDDIPVTGIDAATGTVAKQAKRLVKNTNKPATLAQLDKLARRAKPNKVSATNEELRDARLFKDNVDEFIERIDPAKGPKGRQTKELLDKSRDFTRRARNAERIEDIVETASTNATGGLAGKLKTQEDVRRQLKALIKRKDFKFFKKPEQAAIKQIVKGGKIDTPLRLLGKFQPTGLHSMTVGGGALAALGPTGAAIPVGGTIARQLADQRTRSAVRDLVRLIQAGSQQAAARPTTAASRLVANPENQRQAAAAAGLIGAQNF